MPCLNLKGFRKMSNVKNITVNYFQMYSQEEWAFDTIAEKLSTLMENNMNFGFFEVGEREIMFKLFEHMELGGNPVFIIGLVKEKSSWPVWFDREGNLEDIPLDAGTIGEISYALINPYRRLALTIGSGIASPGMGAFVNYLRWLTDSETLGFKPVFVGDAYDQVQSWEMFRKINMSFEAPTADFVDEALNTEAGKDLTILNTLGGLKIDMTVSMGHSKGSLGAEQVKRFINDVLTENFAKKLTITGKGFTGQETEEYDLYNAKLKFKTEIALSGMHVGIEEARSVLSTAYLTEKEYIENLEFISPDPTED